MPKDAHGQETQKAERFHSKTSLKVKNMRYMFKEADSFSQNLNSWDVSNVEYMDEMFEDSSFDGEISDWIVSKLKSLAGMFSGDSSFNKNIGNWVLDSLGMIDNEEYCTDYNGAIRIRGLHSTFKNATSFDQYLGDWDVSRVKHMEDMFSGVTLSTSNYDNLLIGWSGQSLQNNVNFSAGNSKYSTNGKNAKTNIVDIHHWNITDGGEEP
jgi:hypothetical protein